MKGKCFALFIISFFIALILSSCTQEPPRPEGAFSSAELLADPIYETPIEVYGQVLGLGEFECPCFSLKSDDVQIYIWYDMMVEEDGSQRPPTNIEGIENDDWVVVTGELKYFKITIIEGMEHVDKKASTAYLNHNLGIGFSTGLQPKSG